MVLRQDRAVPRVGRKLGDQLVEDFDGPAVARLRLRLSLGVIQRAAEQWFIALDKPFVASDESEGTEPRSLRQRAMDAIQNTVRFIPEWGSRRIAGMVEGRPDWSISRQRFWGLPIPVFYNPAGEPLLTPESVRAVARHFKEHGSDVWYTRTPAELLGADFRYPPGFRANELRKEQDTFDVGFDSGTSWHAVLYCNSRLTFPCEMYLEGSDQHRGWFHSSLLMSEALYERAPYKGVLTHGFTVDDKGRKMSKSLGNVIAPQKIMSTLGADIMRLWIAATDYANEMSLSEEILKRISDSYRRKRNTGRHASPQFSEVDTQTLELRGNSQQPGGDDRLRRGHPPSFPAWRVGSSSWHMRAWSTKGCASTIRENQKPPNHNPATEPAHRKPEGDAS